MYAQTYFIKKHAVFRMFEMVSRETDGNERSNHAKLARIGLGVRNQMRLHLLQILVEYSRISCLFDAFLLSLQ